MAFQSTWELCLAERMLSRHFLSHHEPVCENLTVLARGLSKISLKTRCSVPNRSNVSGCPTSVFYRKADVGTLRSKARQLVSNQGSRHYAQERLEGGITAENVAVVYRPPSPRLSATQHSKDKAGVRATALIKW